MPKPLTGAGLIQNLLQIAVDEPERKKGKEKKKLVDESTQASEIQKI